MGHIPRSWVFGYSGICQGAVTRPEYTTGGWFITDSAGQFSPDPAVRCLALSAAVTTFRAQLRAAPAFHRSAPESMTPAELSDLCLELLSPTTQLEELKLYGTDLGDDGCEAIASALCTNFTLRRLQLRDQHISDRGAKAFAKALAINKGLRMVSLRQNCITSSGAKLLARALQRNNTLVGISLRENLVDDVGAKSLVSSLMQHKTLRGVALYDCRIKAIDMLTARADRTLVTVFEFQPPTSSNVAETGF